MGLCEACTGANSGDARAGGRAGGRQAHKCTALLLSSICGSTQLYCRFFGRPLLPLQVLNDLLDPARTNLKLREDARRGVVAGVNVEGIREETLVSAEHALQVIAQGNEQRKVTGCGGAGVLGGGMRFRGATGTLLLESEPIPFATAIRHAQLLFACLFACLPARPPACCRPVPLPSTRARPAPTQSFASQSRLRVRGRDGLSWARQGRAAACNTILLQLACVRHDAPALTHASALTKDAPARPPMPLPCNPADRADALTDPNARLGRTLSFLHLIDLAGSESAKVGGGAWHLVVIWRVHVGLVTSRPPSASAVNRPFAAAAAAARFPLLAAARRSTAVCCRPR